MLKILVFKESKITWNVDVSVPMYLSNFYLKFSSAYRRSSSRKSGCAMAIMASARSFKVSPVSFAIPYSVATY